MPEQWLSVAQAAAAMKVHPRTIERRIAARKIESRRNDDGQVEVLVAVPDVVEQMPAEAFDTMKEMADRQVDLAAGSASALIRIAQDQTMRTESQLLLARQDAGRYRHDAKLALTALVATLLLVIGAVGWCTYTVTKVRADARQAADTAARAQTEGKRVAEDAYQAEIRAKLERDDEESRARQAEIARAKAEGELAAYKVELSGVVGLTAKKPAATQPGNLVQRITQAFIGE